ncbi:MAG TPA: dethiobiotin synthase [Desulfuromonadales bacterium]|nr:dethiobiotin synthase [Desulfuromonadales bacterium]
MAVRGIFVTGTDTGVGKTVVAATLARLLRLQGVRVGIMKPVTSGCTLQGGELVSDDAVLLCQAATIPYSVDVAPYCLTEPLAPADAAAIDGVRIEFSRIKAAYERLSAVSDFMIVEGVGGLMVPLAGGLLVADLARDLGLPLLVVARPGLGTINHSVLTCFAATQMELPLAGVIINGMPENPGLAERKAPHQIGGLCGTAVLGVWPRRGDAETEQIELVEQLAEWLAGQAETEIVLRELGVGS